MGKLLGALVFGEGAGDTGRGVMGTSAVAVAVELLQPREREGLMSSSRCSFFAFLGAVGTWVTTGLRYDVTMIIIVVIIIVGV